MSVTIADLLRLPCLSEAEVVAGKSGLNKIVSSISVLEYANMGSLLDEFFNNNEFNGGELVITGFTNIKDDVDAQCANIQRLNDVGEVGIILYYVGIFLPDIDKRLIELADLLQFPLICMPRNRINLRYSEVICEVMEAIYKDQLKETYFVSEILERISHLPEHQRSIDTVMKMLSDRLRASVILTDASGHLLNAAAWPRTREIDLKDVHLPAEETKKSLDPKSMHDGKNRQLIYRRTVADGFSADNMTLFIIKENEPLKSDAVTQAAELIQFSVNLWSRHHSGIVISELVRAILQDEPIKMRRLAEVFNIDVAAINTMWVVSSRLDFSSGEEQLQAERQICEIVRESLSCRYKTFFADVYDHTVVAFMDDSAGGDTESSQAQTLYENLEKKGQPVYLTLCCNLATTTDVRQTYLIIKKYLAVAQKIFPDKKIFTSQELMFAKRCHDIIEQGEESINKKLAVLNLCRQPDLRETLAVYLLDAGASISATADKMFLHKNTIKYRIQRINELLHCRVDKMPEAFSYYLASALQRILNSE